MRLTTLETNNHSALILIYPNTTVATSWLGFKSSGFVPALYAAVRFYCDSLNISCLLQGLNTILSCSLASVNFTCHVLYIYKAVRVNLLKVNGVSSLYDRIGDFLVGTYIINGNALFVFSSNQCCFLLLQVRAMEQRLCDWPAGTDGAPRAITRLEGQIEEQV